MLPSHSEGGSEAVLLSDIFWLSSRRLQQLSAKLTEASRKVKEDPGRSEGSRGTPASGMPLPELLASLRQTSLDLAELADLVIYEEGPAIGGASAAGLAPGADVAAPGGDICKCVGVG